jgi:hypothetical protein
MPPETGLTIIRTFFFIISLLIKTTNLEDIYKCNIINEAYFKLYRGYANEQN